jgi:hypothetical protein
VEELVVLAEHSGMVDLQGLESPLLVVGDQTGSSSGTTFRCTWWSHNRSQTWSLRAHLVVLLRERGSCEVRQIQAYIPRHLGRPRFCLELCQLVVQCCIHGCKPTGAKGDQCSIPLVSVFLASSFASINLRIIFHSLVRCFSCMSVKVKC